MRRVYLERDTFYKRRDIGISLCKFDSQYCLELAYWYGSLCFTFSNGTEDIGGN